MSEVRSVRKLLLEIVLLGVVGVLAFAGLAVYCIRMPGASYRGDLPPLDDGQQALGNRLDAHVQRLAGQIGERNYVRLSQLHQAADYIERQFADMGFVPANQAFGANQYRNISVDIYGRDRRDEIIIVGAHYDTTWLTPGADDNASGVAGMLEIARSLRERRMKRSIRCIAFVNEEEPFFGREEMGSQVSAKRSYDRKENILGMFSLEMIGYYSNEARSQYYPRIIRRFYPRRGNFIAFVANLGSRELLHEAVSGFRRRAAFPSEGLGAPEWLVPDIRRSDNASYWFYGFPAVMVTDTSYYRNFNYHNVGDVPGTLDFDRMARVVSGLTEMIADLADR